VDHRKAYDLLARGDVEGALTLTGALIGRPDTTAGALAARATVLKAAGRPQEALAANRTAVSRFPGNAVCWHNLASTLGDLGQAQEAEAAARKAIALGLGAPETRLVLARALQEQQRFDDAEQAFITAIDARPEYEDAHKELAQLIWMRTGDRQAALARLERAAAALPGHPGLRYTLAIAHEFTGQPEAARRVIETALAVAPRDARLLGLAVEVCCELDDAAAAVRWAGVTSGFGIGGANALTAQALLAAGEAEAARQAAERAVAEAPNHQFALALQATAWRLTGDQRYRAMYDYDRLVGAYDIFDEDKAEDREYLETLRGALHRLHGFTVHPFSQSVRGGGQAPLRLDGRHEAPIELLLQRFRATLQRHIDAIGLGDTVFDRRNTGAVELSGAWSVRLEASGHHTNHVHPMGWISSAFYVSTPDESEDAEAKPGWIKFGEPGVRTTPPLAPERHVQPKPGRLVLFPSYMWHGTVPFASNQQRLTVAFDAVPAKPSA
jgi:tetratricopeptide (TPR) repeat protein